MDYKLQVYYNTNNLNCQWIFCHKKLGRWGLWYTMFLCNVYKRPLFAAVKKYCASRVGIRTGDGKLSFAQHRGVVLD